MNNKYIKICALFTALLISISCLPVQSFAQVTQGTSYAIEKDDFENISETNKYWSDKFTQVADAGNHYGKITKKGLVTSSYFDGYLRPKEVELTVSALASSNFGIFLSTNTGNQTNKGLWFYNSFAKRMLGIWGYGADKNESARITTFDKNMAKTPDTPYIRLCNSDFIKIKMQMDYSEWKSSRRVNVTYTVTGKIFGINTDGQDWTEQTEGYDANNVYYTKNGTVYHIGDEFTFEPATYSFTYEGADYETPLRLCIGSPESQATFAVDNYSASYDTEHGELCRFIGENKSALNGSDTSDSAMNNALNAYLTLSSNAKTLVEELYSSQIEHIADYAAKNSTDSKVISFRNNNRIVLALSETEINPGYEADLSAAFAEYDGLNEYQRFCLLKEYNCLKKLRTALDNYISPRPSGDLSDWTEDFSSGTTKNWVLTTKPNDTKYDYYTDIKVVSDPDDSSNKVLSFDQSGGFILTPNPSTWPEKGAMTHVSYRFRGKPGLNNSYRHKLYVYYIDEDNYAYICVSAANSTYLVTVTDGLSKQSANQLSTPIDIENWMTVDTVYNHAKSEFNCVITDINGKAIVWSGNIANASGRFAIGQERNAMFSSGAYVDDIKISFELGDWDTNEVITEIEPYYTGNVWMNPGDIVTFTGEKLGNTVKEVQLIRIPDTDIGKIGETVAYPGQQTYKYEPDSDTNRLKRSMDSYLDAYTFTEDDKVEIEQTTLDSIKFRIPKTMTAGIYAAKLINRVGGKDSVVIINNPYIGFVSGNDGGSVELGGDLRVIGRKIVYNDYQKSRVALVEQSSGNIAAVLTPSSSEDNYSLHVTVPANLKTGKYDVYVHNGFGDNNLWSSAGTVNVTANDVRSGWPQKIFDVTEFGAVGDLATNDTPAFIAAMEAAAENGGGIVYVPAGKYTLIHTLTIPEKVSFRGDGIEKTHIFWDVGTWDMGAARTLISGSNNVEITGMSLYTSRRREIMYFNGDSSNPRENIYVHNVRVKIYGLTETMSQGSGNVGYDERYTVGELRLMLIGELNNVSKTSSFYVGESSVNDQNNIHFENLDLSFDEAIGVAGFITAGYYYNLRNVNVKNGSLSWLHGAAYDYGIIEENDFGENVCVGLQGNNMYFARNYFHDNMQNNRELYTTDGGYYAKDLILKQDTAFTNGCVYKVYGTNLSADYTGKMLMVAFGQGYSQIRRIVSNSSDSIVLDKPFAVAPNRNSRCFIQVSRTDNIFVDNTCYNGGAFGSYGTMIDYVFDNNNFEQSLGYCMDIWTQCIWGVSMINGSMKDPFYTHGTSSITGSANQTRYRGISLKSQGARYSGAMNNMLVRDIDMSGGAFIEIAVSSIGNCFKDLTVQRNTFTDTEKAIDLVSGNTGIVHDFIDGFLLADNVYSACAQKYTKTFTEVYNRNAKNKAGDLRIKLAGESSPTVEVKGDANNDGIFTLKDVTYLQYYLIEQIDVDDVKGLTKRADVNGDGKLDLRDVNLMRRAIFAGGWDKIEMPDNTSSDSSTSSSSNDSSDNPSSSDSSSESSSSESSSSSSSSSSASGGMTGEIVDDKDVFN